MDLCIPTFKAANGADFDGHSGEYDKYLARERPVGWREEQRKLDYMSNSVDDGAEKFIKIRMINRDTIVASQVRQLDILKYYYLNSKHLPFAELLFQYKHCSDGDEAASLCIA